MQGTLVISLDFELLWGVFDKVDWTKKFEYFNNTREAIPKVLQLFEKHEISCTWATVGMLYNRNWDEWNANIPDILPNYNEQKLSAYHFGKSIQSKETEKLCFAPKLIKQIVNTPGQEIGTHTYSHYYCLEPGQEINSFKIDLEKCIQLAEKENIGLKSLVFPRNQFNNNYLEICSKLGVTNIRSNPDNWYWRDTQKDTLAQKIFRTGDAYIGRNNKSYKEGKRLPTGVVSQKASRLFRPHSGRVILDTLRLKRIKTEMETAARKNEIYHLWWHPHNFGDNPVKSLQELQELCKYYKKLQARFGMRSFNMMQIEA